MQRLTLTPYQRRAAIDHTTAAVYRYQSLPAKMLLSRPRRHSSLPGAQVDSGLLLLVNVTIKLAAVQVDARVLTLILRVLFLVFARVYMFVSHLGVFLPSFVACWHVIYLGLTVASLCCSRISGRTTPSCSQNCRTMGAPRTFTLSRVRRTTTAAGSASTQRTLQCWSGFRSGGEISSATRAWWWQRTSRERESESE